MPSDNIIETECCCIFFIKFEQTKTFMKKLIIILLMVSPFVSNGQNIQVAIGNSFSTMDWQFKYDWGGVEEFYTAPIIGAAIDLNVEYMEKDWYSLSSNFGFFQSGGKIATAEVHDNWIVTETANMGYNLSLGTNFNFIPINNRLQLMLSIGPRIDYLIPQENSTMDRLDDIRKIHLGITGSPAVYYKFDKIKIGLRASYLHRFTYLMNTEPYISDNWWEPSKLGVVAKDRSIINSQFVIGFQL